MTKKDLIKKYETNVKSAFGLYALNGILGLIYIIRYFFSGNLNFYFSIYSTEYLLALFDSKGGSFFELSKALPYLLGIIIIAILYATAGIITLKKESCLKFCLGLYLLDFAFLLLNVFVLSHKCPLDDAIVINIIVHFLISLFLIVGVISQKKLKAVK